MYNGIMEWILHSKHYSKEVKMSVVVVVIGVGVCTVTDVKVNAKGFLCACVAVLCSSLQQISIGSLQKKYSVGSFELLSKTAPIQAGSLLVLGPFVDYYLSDKFILDYKYTSGSIEQEATNLHVYYTATSEKAAKLHFQSVLFKKLTRMKKFYLLEQLPPMLYYALSSTLPRRLLKPSASRSSGPPKNKVAVCCKELAPIV
ncbi:hypothetical protein Leryth_002493 [Lithospermum erythrorhizon]|nr:hypothetical protein Leryth_002493 [Lithospermum erythrorhizon]